MNRFTVTSRVATYGMFGNVLLALCKVTIGLMAGSQAMLADGLNSTGDVLSSLLTWIGNRIASVPSDQDHPFGHGKAEYIFSLGIGAAMVIAACIMVNESIQSILKKSAPQHVLALVAVVLLTLAVKSFLFVYTHKAAAQYDSLLLRANAMDHRNDIFVSLGTLLGVMGPRIGLPWLDGVCGLLISVWLAIAGARIVWAAYRVLMDSNVDAPLRTSIEGALRHIEGIDHVDDVIAKPVGALFLLVVKVSVDGDMSVRNSHAIAGHIRADLKALKNVADVVVHINPT